MTSIFVAKLDFNITGEQLKHAFQAYGTVIKATVATDRETGKSRGFGFVEMADRDEAFAAIKGLDGSMMNGRPIAVKEAEQRSDNRPNRDKRPDFNRTLRETRPDFNRNRDQGNNYSRPASAERMERPEPRESGGFTPPLVVEDPFKMERKKVRTPDKDKKIKEKDVEGKSKKPKMSAYKKSGKNNRFFDDNDDLDDLDNTSFFNFDDEEEDDED